MERTSNHVPAISEYLSLGLPQATIVGPEEEDAEDGIEMQCYSELQRDVEMPDVSPRIMSFLEQSCYGYNDDVIDIERPSQAFEASSMLAAPAPIMIRPAAASQKPVAASDDACMASSEHLRQSSSSGGCVDIPIAPEKIPERRASGCGRENIRMFSLEEIVSWKIMECISFFNDEKIGFICDAKGTAKKSKDDGIAEMAAAQIDLAMLFYSNATMINLLIKYGLKSNYATDVLKYIFSALTGGVDKLKFKYGKATIDRIPSLSCLNAMLNASKEDINIFTMSHSFSPSDEVIARVNLKLIDIRKKLEAISEKLFLVFAYSDNMRSARTTAEIIGKLWFLSEIFVSSDLKTNCIPDEAMVSNIASNMMKDFYKSRIPSSYMLLIDALRDLYQVAAEQSKFERRHLFA